MSSAIAVVFWFIASGTPSVSSAATGRRPQQSVTEVVKAAVDSVVLIVISDRNGKPVAEGSGFIASSDGKIVTNHHVIVGALSAVVKLNNGAFFQVDGVLADDPEHDVAVIKVAGKNLPSLSFADSDRLSAGDHVIAIGSPLGLENSVSDGIISGFREDPKGRTWVQTTAPASHGNSGGPLLTMDDIVAGVVTWKAAGGENLNFAVPSKLISGLLAGSNVRPLGTEISAAPPPNAGQDRIWTSLTVGRDFKLRIDGDYVYTEWVNLPTKLQSTGAFLRQELRKTGDKWIGKTHAYLPFPYRGATKWCRADGDLEISKLSDARIEGQALGWSAYDAKNCRPEKLEWKPFVWIPK